MAAPKYEIKPFKNGYAIYRDGELHTRTDTEEAAEEYLERLGVGRRRRKAADTPTTTEEGD